MILEYGSLTMSLIWVRRPPGGAAGDADADAGGEGEGAIAGGVDADEEAEGGTAGVADAEADADGEGEEGETCIRFMVLRVLTGRLTGWLIECRWGC